MMRSRSGLVLLALGCFSSVTAAQGLVFREDFESGAPGWTFNSLWHVESQTTPCAAQPAPFPSPGHCAWYGWSHVVGSTSVCDYEGGNIFGAVLAMPALVLPANPGSIVLRYRRFLNSEHCAKGYDVSLVRVVGSNGETSGTDCGNEPGWTDRRLDLSAWAGQSVQARFEFHSNDGQFDGYLGWWIDDVEIAAEPGVVTCVAGPTCPCPGQSYGGYVGPNENGGGCKHSFQKEALLFGNGTHSVSADTVELVVHDLPPQTSLIYVQGSTQQSIPFGDGKRCFGGTAIRLAVHNSAGGQDTYPHAGESNIALKGSIPALGATRTYQVVYRDAAAYCTLSTFNTSNGYVIAWTP